MTLNTILQAKDILEKIYHLSLGGGKDLKFRKLIKKFNEEAKLFEELRIDFIKTKGETEGEGDSQTFSIKPDTPIYKEYINYINQLAFSEVDIKTEVLFADEDIERLEFSGFDIDNLIALGLYKE